jgi:hypothetical protein
MPMLPLTNDELIYDAASWRASSLKEVIRSISYDMLQPLPETGAIVAEWRPSLRVYGVNYNPPDGKAAERSRVIEGQENRVMAPIIGGVGIRTWIFTPS